MDAPTPTPGVIAVTSGFIIEQAPNPKQKTGSGLSKKRVKSAPRKRLTRRREAPSSIRHVAMPFAPGISVFSRYIRCLTRGIPAQTGVPDGNSSPSVTRNLRFRHTFKPDANGDLTLAIVLTPMGVVQQLVGLSQSVAQFVLEPTYASGVKLNPAAGTTNYYPTAHLSIVPLDPTVSVGSSGDNVSATLRLVNAVHTISFTGSSLNNGGLVTADTFDLTRYVPSTIATSHTPRAVTFSTSSLSSVGLSSSALVGPARDPFTVVSLPTSADYVSPSLVVNNTNNGDQRIGCQGRAGWTPLTNRAHILQYSGLSSDASITIDSRVCVQEQINAVKSSWLPFTKPSEMAAPGLLDAFLGKAGTERLMDWGYQKVTTGLKNAARYAITATTGIPMVLDEL